MYRLLESRHFFWCKTSESQYPAKRAMIPSEIGAIRFYLRPSAVQPFVRGFIRVHSRFSFRVHSRLLFSEVSLDYLRVATDLVWGAFGDGYPVV